MGKKDVSKLVEIMNDYVTRRDYFNLRPNKAKFQNYVSLRYSGEIGKTMLGKDYDAAIREMGLPPRYEISCTKK